MENGDIWHMPDGPEHRARDADMMEMGASDEDTAAHARQQKQAKSNPNRWSDPEF